MNFFPCSSAATRVVDIIRCLQIFHAGRSLMAMYKNSCRKSSNLTQKYYMVVCMICVMSIVFIPYPSLNVAFEIHCKCLTQTQFLQGYRRKVTSL